MKILRTPDERFEGLPDWPHEPHYADIADGLRAHYIDVGPRDAPPILLMHGEPTWGYLYRHVVAALVDDGHRCVVPDLIGFGRSDKPADTDDYSYGRHVDWMQQLLFGHLDLRDITYFGQDWGGLIGLRLVAAAPERYARICIANTGLPTGDGKLSDAFLAWQRYSKESPTFEIGRIIARGCAQPMGPEVIAAYDAPFPDDSYKAGARILPSLVPTSPHDPAHVDNATAWDVLRRFDRPFLCAFSDSDAVTAGGERIFLREVPGTKDQPHTTIEGGGHFLQEDKGPELAKVLIDFVRATS